MQMYHVDFYDYDGAKSFETMASSAQDAIEQCVKANGSNPGFVITGDAYIKKF
jgi:hypothetical protein